LIEATLELRDHSPHQRRSAEPGIAHLDEWVTTIESFENVLGGTERRPTTI
jgi:hypothetical protein